LIDSLWRRAREARFTDTEKYRGVVGYNIDISRCLDLTSAETLTNSQYLV